MVNYSIEECQGSTFITLSNDANLRLTLCTKGASVYSLSYYNQPMILTISSKEKFLNSNQYFGKTLGQLAGRITKEQTINGKKVVLENNDGELVLHGGANNISYEDFSYKIKENNKNIIVIFSFVTRKNQCGFPGKTNFHVTYEISKNSDIISVKFKAIPSEDTLINMSNHMYFNFGATDVTNYKIKVEASNILKCDSHLLPVATEKIYHALDFRKLTKLSARLHEIENYLPAKTIDHTFLFDEIKKQKRQVILSNGNCKLCISTTDEACNIYLDNSGTDVQFINSPDLKLRRGLAIEPQRNILSRDRILIKSHDKYEDKITYKFYKI